MTDSRPSWDAYYMALVDVVASRATCPKRSVGAVIVHPTTRSIVATGYNGVPSGMPHCTERGRCVETNGHCVMSLHAEQNCILQAALIGTALPGCVMYTTYQPCLNCSLAIARVRLTTVVYKEPYVTHTKDRRLQYAHAVSLMRAGEVFRFAGVTLRRLE